MKKLQNTLFVTSENGYLSLDGENIVISRDRVEAARFPLHTLSEIFSFSYAGASPALMGACAKRNIGLAFCTPRGRFLCRVNGESSGNVLLRREQYRVADDPLQSCRMARMSIFGKLFNSRKSIERALRDHSLRVDASALRNASDNLASLLPGVRSETDMGSLRGLEGSGAQSYFSVFNEMILTRKETFRFDGRSRRPPLDPVNALLSFAYSLLTNDCASALEAVGLDSYVGFMHRDRPGRKSLALDLMEELRPCFADRFVLTIINTRVMDENDFLRQDDGAVLLSEKGRKTFLKAWQEKKQEELKHPFLDEKLQWGMVPYVQALLLARTLRGDLDEYPPFLWR